MQTMLLKIGRGQVLGVMLWAAGAATGCDLFASDVVVSLSVSHHGMRQMNGMLPDYGEADSTRVFVNDQGWEVSLAEAVIVTKMAQIESCAGEVHEFRLPYGPLTEYQLDQDMGLIDFATVSLPAGTYCTLRIEYGRYVAEEAAQASEEPYAVQGHANVEGLTVYLAGTAEELSSGTVVNWGLKTANTALVEMDLSTSENEGPFTITGEEPGGKQLTVAKTYDAFFRGVNFNTFDQAASEAGLLGVLTAETYVRVGSAIY